MNFFPVTVAATDGATATVSAPGLAPLTVTMAPEARLAKGAALTLGIRPETIAVVDASKETATIEGRTRLVEHLGRETILYVDGGALRCSGSESGTGDLVVQLGQVTPIAAEAPVGLRIDPAEVYLFSPEDGRRLTARKSVIQQ
jgi:multiple sugar transport system ATP-binding protein